MARYYSRASIFAFPSLDEGFGMPVLEAMRAGVAVVAANRSAIPEVCGGAAQLVDALDTEALASALLGLAKDETKREEMERRGQSRAQQFSWLRAADETWAVYRELL
jgi:glycosyltransferase involved in cell wall biosynthesis